MEIAKLTGDATAAQPFIERRKVVVPWLLEFAVQAANNGFPRAAGKLTLAAQLLGERLDSE